MRHLLSRYLLVLGLMLLCTPPAIAELIVGDYELINTKRLSLTEYQYSYRAQLTNTGEAALNDVTAILNMSSDNVSIIDDTLSFGNVPAGSTVTSSDTVVFNYDRSQAFNGEISWTIQIGTTPELPSLVHPEKGNAVLLGSDANETSGMPTQFYGGVSVDGENFVTNGTATNFQEVSVRVNIEVQPEYVGQKADLLLVIATKQQVASDEEETETFYRTVSSLNNLYPLYIPPEGWQPKLITAFNRGVTLQETTPVDFQYDKFTVPGMYYFFVGYRLDNGDIIYNPMPITLEVQAGEQPYFPGIVEIVSTNVDSASLAWLPATDNNTPVDAITYDIHLSDQSDFEPTGNTLYTSVVGANQTDLVGLTTATSYNVLIVAEDADGNRSQERDYRTVTTFDQPVVVNSAANFAEDKQLGLGEATTQDGTVFTYSAASPSVQPEVDSVLFVNVGEDVYLRKVDSVESTTQGLVVRTSDAELAYVLETATIDTQVTLFDVSQAALQSDSLFGVRTSHSLQTDGSSHYTIRWQNDSLVAKQENYVGDDSNVEVTHGINGEHIARVKRDNEVSPPVELRTNVAFEPSLETKVVLDRFNVKEAKVIARGQLSAEVGASFNFQAAGSVEKEIVVFSKTTTSRYTIPPGIPVYQRTTLSLKAVLSANATTEIKADAVAEAVAGIEVGVKYNPTTRTWEKIPPTPNFEKDFEVNISAHGKVVGTVRLIPNLQVEFYRILATDMSIEPFLTTTVAAETMSHADNLENWDYLKTQLTQFDVDLQAQAFVGVSFGIFSNKFPLLDKTQIWESPKWTLFSLPKLNLNGASGEVNEAITLTATTEDGKNNPFSLGSIKWNAYPSKNASVSGGKTGTFTASEERTYTVSFSGLSRKLPDPFGRQFAFAEVNVGDDKIDLTGVWESTEVNNHWQMDVTWNQASNQYEGKLIKNGVGSEEVGFTIGELVWIATPTSNPDELRQRQKVRSGRDGVSSGFFWIDGIVYLNQTTDSTLVTSGSTFRKVGRKRRADIN